MTPTTSFFRKVLLGSLALALGFAPSAYAITAADCYTASPGKVIDLYGIKKINKPVRLAIAGYQVSFVVRNKATAHAMNVLGRGTAKSSMETFLGNVDYALMQQITDAAYADFVEQMKATGHQVLSDEEVKGAKAYAKLAKVPVSATNAHYTKMQNMHIIVVPATGVPLWFNKFDGLSANKGADNVQTMGELEKELNAVVLQPSICLDFAYLDAAGGKFARKASVEAQNGMLLVPAATVYWSTGGGGLVYTKFQDGVWVDGPTGKWTNAKSENNASLVKGLAGLGIDIGPVSGKKAIVLEAEPEAFKAKSIEVLKAAHNLYRRGLTDARK
jgi:hypothetical protein